jgi:hypothetical protein
VVVAVFPSLEYVQQLQEHCNGLEDFQKATDWSDVNVVLAMGDKRYWLKLYRGRVMDLMEYLPVSNALGYDVIVSGDEPAWRQLAMGTKSWEQLTTGRITIEGNLLEANRLHEALCILMESLADVPGEASNVA